jgi:CDP-diacylglycerol--glycerol-3-phosphate 3-phosphatidyltransferase
MTSSAPEQTPQAPLWNIANIFTMLRIVLVPFFIWFFVLDGDARRWAAAGVFLLASATDKVDGYLARSLNLVTNFGKLADPIADKLLVSSALILLSLFGELSWIITGLLLLREVSITVLREVMRKREVVMPASRSGKLKTVLQMVFIGLLLVPWATILPADPAEWIRIAALVVAWAAVAVGVISGVLYFVAAALNMRAARRSAA